MSLENVSSFQRCQCVSERRGGSPIYIANKGEHNNGNKINQGVNYNTISLFSKRAKNQKIFKKIIS